MTVEVEEMGYKLLAICSSRSLSQSLGFQRLSTDVARRAVGCTLSRKTDRLRVCLFLLTGKQKNKLEGLFVLLTGKQKQVCTLFFVVKVA